MQRDVLKLPRILVRIILTMVAVCSLVTIGDGQETLISSTDGTSIDVQKAAKVKAVYLYSFSQFTKWPETVLEKKPEFTIGVVGTTPVSDSLTQIANKRTVHDKKIVLKTYNSASEVKPEECEVLFLSSSITPNDAAALSQSLSNSSTLIVTESPDRPVNTIVNFLIENQGVHFEINNEEAQRRNLAMDARLLRQGRIMQTAIPSSNP